MSSLSETDSQPGPFTIAALPSPVDAGADLHISALAHFDPPRDITGIPFPLRDGSGETLGQLVFASFDGETNRTEDLVLAAPLTEGTHEWTVLCTDDDRELTVPLAIEVRAHQVTLLAWDVPATTVLGQAARFNIGMKCSAGCDHAGAEIILRDQQGRERARSTIGSELWPGTQHMQYGEVEVVPDAEIGLHAWTAEIDPSSLDLPHAGANAQFTLRVVAEPECEVTVEVRGEDGQTPMAGAHVVLHPYRGISDDDGNARFMVPKGSYRVQVSKARHEAVSTTLEVAGDVTTRARLSHEPPEDPDAHYY